MNIFVIVINCILITTIYANSTLTTDQITSGTTSINTSSTTATMVSSTTTTTISNSSNDTISSTTFSTLSPGESPPTRSAQLGMGLGITLIGILIIGELIYFNCFYRNNLRSDSYLS